MPANQQYARKLLKFLCRGLNTASPRDLLPEGKFSKLVNVRPAIQAGALQSRQGTVVYSAAPLGTDTVDGSTQGVHSIRRINDNMGPDRTFVGDYYHVVGSGKRVAYESNTGTHAFTELTPVGAGSTNVWSGRPLSLIPWRPDISPRAWMYVYDAELQQKVGRDDSTIPAATVMQNIGIAPPITEATSTGGAGAVYYRYTYRSSGTGVTSNPSPIMLTSVATGGVVTAVASTDPQVDYIDFYRFGGALFDYFFIGSAPNATPTFTDNVSDADAQLNLILSEDNDQPWSVVGLPLAGNCTVVFAGGATTVTWVPLPGGEGFYASQKDLAMKPGTIVLLGTPGTGLKAYQTWKVPSAEDTLQVIGDATGSTIFQIQQPILQNKAMPFTWGPFNNTIFGCGDFFNPGTLYWSNPGNPDGAAAANSQEITNPSEPLINGFVYDGKNYVFSSERLFAIYPDFSNPNHWEIIETPCQRGMWTNWCYCINGEKEGGGEIYFLSKDGIYMTTGGQAVCLTTPDLTNLFPYEGYDKNQSFNGMFPVDMTERNYLRLAYKDHKVYFDYKDTEGGVRQLIYDQYVSGWLTDVYPNSLRHHYGGEGREVEELLAGSDNGVIYQYENTGDDYGSIINCIVRTHSEDFGDPGAQKLAGQVMVDLEFGDTASVAATPYFNNEAVAGGTITLTGSSRAQRIVDISAGEGVTCYNVALDLSWDTSGNVATMFQWEPSAVQKPEDTQQRCIEWHEFMAGGNDSYVMGVILWVDTRDLSGTPQTKTIQIWSDEAYTGNTITVNSNGEQKLEFSWPFFKGKLARLLPTDTNRCRVLKWEWIAQAEPLLISKWDTNWIPLGERTAIGYVTGIVVVADTLGINKTLSFQYEFEGTVVNLTAIGGSNIINGSQRITKSFGFTPFRAEQLRMYSYDDVIGRLYTWEWVIHYVEPRFLPNWDATYEWWEGERLIKGVRLDADTLGVAKTVNVELDGAVYTTLTVTHTGREALHYDMPLDLTTNEYPRARIVRLYPTDVNYAFLYSIKWFADPEPGRLANWNAKWEDGGHAGAKFLQGFILDADTEGVTKTVIVDYYPESSASAIQASASFAVNHTGRSGKAYSFEQPIVAHKFRLRPTDTNQKWLYGVQWVFEPHPESVTHWETQAYSHGLASYQHRRDAYIAYESNDVVYWIIDIDGVQKTYVLPTTGGEYRKVYVPLMAIKGKLFKDTFTCAVPDPVTQPIVYYAVLQDAAF